MDLKKYFRLSEVTQAQKDEPHMLFHYCISQLEIFRIMCLIGCIRESQETGPSSEIYLGSKDSRIQVKGK